MKKLQIRKQKFELAMILWMVMTLWHSLPVSMQTTKIILAIVLVVCLISVLDAKSSQHTSNDLFRERLVNFLLEAERRGLLNDQSLESEESQEHEKRALHSLNNKQTNQRGFIRRKLVGLSDDPY
ncbi:unnamed protein product [Adineta ricciae]|uniref:Uncharacterized protein n=2 Tax=Adineta ricciae TaxID=249248 RepID=A0A814LH54_ADIRI|nr:unnamed protein product [Adineta ricciae]